MDAITYRPVPLTDELTPELIGFLETTRLGFGQGGAPDETHQRWLSDLNRDGFRLEAAWAETAPVQAMPGPVGTFASAPLTVNTGSGHLEKALFITDVTVRATHRRRGILRHLMTDALARARDEGLSLATLTVTEGSIYGRFGFGVATQMRVGHLDTGPRLGWRREVEPRVALVSTQESRAVRDEVFAAFHRTHRGSHERPSFYGDLLTGAWDYEKHAPVRDLYTVVHWDADERPDGVLTYRYAPDHELTVRDLVAVNPEAELALWQYVGSIDLVDKVSFRRLAADSPLPWALTDPRSVKLTALNDSTWLRVLDAPAALAARHFEADGDLTLDLIDPLSLTGGPWRVVVRDGRAEVTRASDAALAVDVRALGSLYFGLVDARTLAAAGLIHGPADEVAALAALFRTLESPENLTSF